jgi:hypothetical protein
MENPPKQNIAFITPFKVGFEVDAHVYVGRVMFGGHSAAASPYRWTSGPLIVTREVHEDTTPLQLVDHLPNPTLLLFLCHFIYEPKYHYAALFLVGFQCIGVKSDIYWYISGVIGGTRWRDGYSGHGTVVDQVMYASTTPPDIILFVHIIANW